MNQRLALISLLTFTWSTLGSPNNNNTDWLPEARYGVFMHLLPGDARQLAQVKDFDVEVLARQLEVVGAKYFVITLGQNSGYIKRDRSSFGHHGAGPVGPFYLRMPGIPQSPIGSKVSERVPLRAT